jgi:exonuclease I
MAGLEVNGLLVAITWDTTSTWRAFVPAPGPADRLTVVALNDRGDPLADARQEITLTLERRLHVQIGANALAFDYPILRSGLYRLEWTPTLSPADWQTLTNRSATLGTLRFEAPIPSAPAFYRVVEP